MLRPCAVLLTALHSPGSSAICLFRRRWIWRCHGLRGVTRFAGVRRWIRNSAQGPNLDSCLEAQVKTPILPRLDPDPTRSRCVTPISLFKETLLLPANDNVEKAALAGYNSTTESLGQNNPTSRPQPAENTAIYQRGRKKNQRASQTRKIYRVAKPLINKIQCNGQNRCRQYHRHSHQNLLTRCQISRHNCRRERRQP